MNISHPLSAAGGLSVFVCTLSHETEIVALHGNGEFIYRAAIGYDDSAQLVYSALVIFSPLPGFGDGTGYELVFRVVESSLEGDHVGEYHDGLQTKAFLSEPSDREAVFELVQHMIALHIDELKPPAVDMVTYTSDLPNAALQKFHKIAAVFGARGYQAGPADPWHGQWVWMMRLP